MRFLNDNPAFWFCFLFSSGVLLIQWHYLWVPHIRDSFRAYLFSLREDLFDYAINGETSFNSEEYAHFRKRLNTTIRIANRLSIADTVQLFIVARDRFKEDVAFESKKTLEIIEAIKSNSSKEYYLKLNTHIGLCALVFMFLRSPFLSFFILICLIGFSLNYKFWKTTEKYFDRFASLVVARSNLNDTPRFIARKV